ncbi:putative tetratricopeptide-like helical domain superfamily [Septoria linicola]|nr:putative tetratricopeptide-like helical domain superfamily [Septoria linicola]
MSVEPWPGNLELLKRPQNPETAIVVLVLVTLPWLLPANKWLINSSRVQETFGGNVWMFAFEQCKKVRDTFPTTGMTHYAENLIDALLDVSESTALGGTPKRFVLLAHSLAGNVVKHGIVLAHAQKTKFWRLQESVHGLVFMGTPHCIDDKSHSLLRESYHKILQIGGCRSRERSEDGCLDAIRIARKFDEVSGNLHIVSLYETKTSSIKGRVRYHDHIVVNQELAQVKSNTKELTAAVAVDHRCLPTLRGHDCSSGTNTHAFGLIRKLLEDAFEAGSEPPGRRAPAVSSDGPDHDPALAPLIEDFATPRPYPKLPCRGLDISRKHNKDFHGRVDALSKLAHHLLASPRTAVVHGISGVGKSELALEFLHRFGDEFDAVFWIQADDIAKVRHSFGRIAVHLGLQTEAEAQATDPHSSRAIAKAWLADPKKVSMTDNDQESMARWLVVFDGLESVATLAEFEPIFRKGSILITTQNPELASTIPYHQDVVQPVKLLFLDEQEASALLKKLAAREGTPTEIEDSAAQEIVRRYGYGGWPLAISQTAHMIRKKYGTSLAEFRDLFTDGETAKADVSSSEYAAIIDVISLARLSSHATAVLQVCAMLDPDCIQERLFSTASEAALLLEGFPTSALQFADARAELSRASIIYRNSEKQELWIHREVQESVRQQCSASDFDIAFRAAAALVRRAWKPPGLQVRDNAKLWEPCASFLGHVVQLQQLYSRCRDMHGENRKSITASLPLAELLAEAASYHINLGNTAGLKANLDLALEVCEQLPPKATFDLRSNIFHSLGAWANETNHAQDCYDYNKRYLAMRIEAVDSGADPTERTAAAWNQWGTGLMMVNRFEDAKDAFQKSIDLYTTVRNETACPDSLPIVNLAVARWLTQDYEGASKLLEFGRLAREDEFGFEDLTSFRMGRFLHALGNVRWDQGDFASSQIWHKRALKQYCSSLSKTHHRTADVRHRMAMHCLREKDHERAGALIDQALESWRLDPESFRHEIARTTWLKARQRAIAGNPPEAADLKQEATKLRAKLRPDDHRSPEELTDQDFDDLVAFWSR